MSALNLIARGPMETKLALCATGSHVYAVLPYLAEAAPSIVLDLLAELDRVTGERDEARGVVRETLWMARRYADGRQSYAVGMFNDAATIAEAGGYAVGEPDGTILAKDGLRPEYKTLEARALAAEADRDRMRRALERAEGWFRDYERQHRAKGTLEGNLKADTNEERADYLRAALTQEDDHVSIPRQAGFRPQP